MDPSSKLNADGFTYTGFRASNSLVLRIDNYLRSTGSIVRTKTELLTLAVEEFLAREEPICRELDRVREEITNRLAQK